jgi:hypothetical protein
MKKILTLLFIIMALTTFGQKQKSKDLQAQIDTLTKENQSLAASGKSLAATSDSLSKELEKYLEMYTVIKNQVVKYDFDPAKMASIIDSLKTGRDSLVNLTSSSKLSSPDSIKLLKRANDSIRKENEGLMYAVNLLRGGTTTNPTDLKDFTGTWKLILRKVSITGDSPRSGIIDISSDPVEKTAGFLEVNTITSVTFLDNEFADLIFSNGEKGKCYFVISEFSKTKPYYIDFKGTKADFRMYFTNTSAGPRISFQIPGTQGKFYFGQMTK